jgi:hypothetical protein
MTAILWLPPPVRALTTATLVISASALAEALGPFWGALAVSLPVSAGPTYAFLAMQHGHDFLAASALSSFASNAATGLFLINAAAGLRFALFFIQAVSMIVMGIAAGTKITAL